MPTGHNGASRDWIAADHGPNACCRCPRTRYFSVSAAPPGFPSIDALSGGSKKDPEGCSKHRIFHEKFGGSEPSAPTVARMVLQRIDPRSFVGTEA
jgi:hypothetical protein